MPRTSSQSQAWQRPVDKKNSMSSTERINVSEKMVNDVLARYVTEEIFSPMATDRQELEWEWIADHAQTMGYFQAEWKEGEINKERSKIFVNLTQRKVLAVMAVITASLFQNGELPCNIEMTPVPQGPWTQLLPKAELYRRTREIYKQIKDWNIQSDFKSEFLEWLWQFVVYGNAFWNTPFPYIKEKEQYVPIGLDPETGELIFQNVIQREIVPAGQALNLWDCFLDPEAKDSQHGRGVIYRPQLRPDQLVDLANSSPLFHKEAAISIAESWEGRDASDITRYGNYDPRKDRLDERKENINVFEFYGRIPGKILLAKHNPFRKKFEKEIPESNSDIQTYECKVIIAENRTIYAGLNRKGTRPIYNATWVKPSFYTYGFGVPRKMRDMQSLTNGLTRAYIDAKRYASIPFGAVNFANLADDETLTFYPGKFFKMDIDEGSQKLGEIFNFQRFPDTANTLDSILQFAIGQADEDSNIPKQMEGQYAQKETTATEVNVTAMGANAQLEMILERVDLQMLIQHFKAQYHYLMINPKYVNIHADADVKATGYKTFIQKTVLQNSLSYVLQMILGTQNQEAVMGTKVTEFLKEIARTKNLDEDKFFYTEEELQQRMYEMMVMQQKAQIDAQKQAQAEEAQKFEQKQFDNKTKNLEPGERQKYMALKERGLLDRAENQSYRSPSTPSPVGV